MTDGGAGVGPESFRASGRARTEWSLADVANGLRTLRIEAGQPSFAEIARRIATVRAERGVAPAEQRPARGTVYDCFRTDRRRIDIDLVVDIVRALGADSTEADQWAQRCRLALSRAEAATMVTVRNRLPMQRTAFVGRTEEMATALSEMPGRSPGNLPTTPIWISGMPGAGKSRFASEVAQRLLDAGVVAQFRAVELRAFAAGAPPADPVASLDALLRSMGVAHHAIPRDLTARVELLARHCAKARFVVVLDDAVGSEQLGALLPGLRNAVVLVTSRTAPDPQTRARHVGLGVLEPMESLELLRATIGTSTIDAEQDAAYALADAAGHLPLAVELTASRVLARPDWPLAEHLGPVRRRQQALRLDDAVHETIDLSYTSLPASAQRMLRALAGAPLAEPDSTAAAALADTSDAQTDLETLLRHHLLNDAGGDRYRLHPLVRTYATERGWEEDRASARTASHVRLEDHLMLSAWAASRSLAAESGGSGRFERFTESVPTLPPDEAREWFENHIEDVVVAAQHALGEGRYATVMALSEGCAWWLARASRYRHAVMLTETALHAALSAGDTTGEALARLDLGGYLGLVGELDTAEAHLLAIPQAHDAATDPGFHGSVANHLAGIAGERGQLERAVRLYQESIDRHRCLGDQRRTAAAFVNLAYTYRMNGQFDESVRTNLDLLTNGDPDPWIRALTLSNLADVYVALEDHDAAWDTAREAAELAEELGHAQATLAAQLTMVRILDLRGKHEEALAHGDRALAAAHDLGHPSNEATVLYELSAVHRHMGDLAHARTLAEQALDTLADVDDDYQSAFAHSHLALIERAEGNAAEAAEHWSRAASLLEPFGGPELEEIRAWLADVRSPETH
ncbi:tetratricopeptide repeat protein [Ruania halotolerans]|uniref:tetratricopeptide repeat protein n=1 Tax=Ruania halotolerans TaxID=2897773 RepID=UPI001E5976BE|nr:tetratricopeptide repeat protein [Ruania halotolerans]UFU06027.1 tetratricopeptide repeat protein [Ruania halotolerans]